MIAINTKAVIKQALYTFLSPFCHSLKKTEVSATALEKAYALLESIHPSYNNSCIRKNEISKNIDTDLQIIVPAYNVEAYIRQCIDSILAQQTKYSFSITIINDGSTDHTADYIEKYRDKSNVTIIHQENGGSSKARNTGLKTLHAKYILFVDGDDRLEQGAIECLIHKAGQTQADIIEGGYIAFQDDNILYKRQPQQTDDLAKSQLSGFPWGKIYKASLFATIGFPDRYRFQDTINTLILFNKCTRVAALPDIVYGYRKNNAGISATSVGDKRCLDTIWISRQLLKDGEQLQIKRDILYSEFLLRQIAVNYKRVHTLHNKAIDRAVFTIAMAWVQEYSNKELPTDNSYKALDKALRQQDYNAYKLFCKLQAW